MAKMTAGMFADLPEELQKKILEEIPAPDLGNIEVIHAKDVDSEEISQGFHETFMSMSRTESIVCLMELLQMVSKRMLPDDMPMPLQMSAQLAMLKQVLEHSKETIKQQEEDSDG